MPRKRVAWWGVALLLVWVQGSPAQDCGESALHTEFTTDPTARTYASCASDGVVTGPNNNDACTLEKFNQLCTNNPACKVDNTVTREAIWEVIDPTELETLQRATAANEVARKTQLADILKITAFNLGKGDVRQKWFNIFTGPASPKTNAAIAALQLKDVPRSQVVCGRPGTIADVSCGLRGDACQ